MEQIQEGMNRVLAAFQAGDEDAFFDYLDRSVYQKAFRRGHGIDLLAEIYLTEGVNGMPFDRFDRFKRRALAGILEQSPASDTLYNDLLYSAAFHGDGDLLHVLLLKGARVDESGVYDWFSPNTWNHPPLEPGAEPNGVYRPRPQNIPAPHVVDMIVLAHELEDKGGSYRDYARAEEDPSAMLKNALNRLEGDQDGGRRKGKKSKKSKKSKSKKGTKRHSRRTYRTRRIRRTRR